MDYLFDAVNAVTTSALTPADITGVWAGLRPLLAPDRAADGSRPAPPISLGATACDIGRRGGDGDRREAHHLPQDGPGHRGPSGPPARARGPCARKCRTKSLALRGAPLPGERTRSAHAGIEASIVAHLHARYGTEVPAVLAVAEQRPELLEPMVAGLPYLGAEVIYAARAEMAQSVDDVLSRRTRATLQDARAAAAAARAGGGAPAAELGWTQEQARAEAATSPRRHSASWRWPAWSPSARDARRRPGPGAGDERPSAPDPGHRRRRRTGRGRRSSGGPTRRRRPKH